MAIRNLKAGVLVIGAGPAGSTAAFSLATAGNEVLLVDRAHFPRPKPCGDGITNRAFGPLERMGLMETIRQRYQPCNGVAIIAPDGHRVEFARQPGGDEYGYVIARNEFDDLLVQRARQAGARFLPGLNIRRGSKKDGYLTGVRGRLKEPDGSDGGWVDIQANVTILASGAGSTLPEALGFPRNYRAQEYVLRAYFEGVHDTDSWEEFFIHRHKSCGYSWIFGMGEGRANVGIGVEPQDAHQFGRPFGCAVEQLIRDDPRLRERFRDAVCTDVWGFPLNAGMRTGPLALPGVLLVGDAAGTTLPINGEGISYAMIGGEMAADYADRVLRTGSMDWDDYDRKLRARFEVGGIFYLRFLELLRYNWVTNRLLRKANRSPWVYSRIEHALLVDLTSYQPRLRGLLRAFSPW